MILGNEGLKFKLYAEVKTTSTTEKIFKEH